MFRSPEGVRSGPLARAGSVLPSTALAAPSSRARSRWLSAMSTLLLMAFMCLLLSSQASASLSQVSGRDPDHLFPTWYSDNSGLSLQLCLDGLPNCLAARADLTPPDGEAFYFEAAADLGPFSIANA